MKLFFFMLVMISGIAHAKAPAEPKGCLPTYKVKYYSKYIHLNLDGYPDYCDPKNHYYRLMEAIIFTAELDFDQSKRAPTPYDAKILGFDWINRLARMMPSIGWGAASTCSRAQAYAEGFTKVRFCLNAFETYNDVSDLVTILLHESRHLEGNGFSHVTCDGRRDGCDPNIYYRGAYSAQMEAYVKMGVNATNLNPALVDSNRRMAYVTAVDRFKVRAIPNMRDESVVLLKEKDHFVAFNYRYEGPAFRYMPAGRLLNAGDHNYVLVPDAVTQAIVPAPGFGIDQVGDGSADDDINESYPNQLLKQLKPEERSLVKDAAFFEQYGGILDLWPIEGVIVGDTVKIRRGKVDRKDSDDGKMVYKTFDVQLPAGTPVAIRTILDGNPEHEDRSFYVLNDKDQLFEIKLDKEKDEVSVGEVPNPYPGFKAVAVIKVSDEYDAWKAQVDKLEKRHSKKSKVPIALPPQPPMKHLVYLLRSDGRLYFVNEYGDPTPVVSMWNRRFEFMSPGMNYWPWLPKELML